MLPFKQYRSMVIMPIDIIKERGLICHAPAIIVS